MNGGGEEEGEEEYVEAVMMKIEKRRRVNLKVTIEICCNGNPRISSESREEHTGRAYKYNPQQPHHHLRHLHPSLSRTDQISGEFGQTSDKNHTASEYSVGIEPHSRLL